MENKICIIDYKEGREKEEELRKERPIILDLDRISKAKRKPSQSRYQTSNEEKERPD